MVLTPTRVPVRLLPLVLTGALFSANVTAAPPAPPPAKGAPADGPEWGSSAKPGEGPAWGGGGGLVIPVKAQTDVTFTPYGASIAVVDAEIWDLKAGKPTGITLEGEYARNGLRALSSDGKLFAAAAKTPNLQDTSVRIWSTETGKQVSEIPGDPREFVDLLRFTGPRALVIAGRMNKIAQVWDVDKNKVASNFKVLGFDQQTSSITPDGRYLAVVAHDHLLVYDVRAGREVARMKDPADEPAGAKLAGGANAQPAGRNIAPAPRPPANPISAVFVYAWTSSIQFSPDGKELAALFRSKSGARLICWDTRGNMIFDEYVPVEPHAFANDQIEWLADRSGWLLAGSVIYDRKSRHAVYIIPQAFGDTPRHRFLDKDRLLCSHGSKLGGVDHLDILTIPFAQINASLAAMAGKGPATLRPTQAISVKIELAGLRGDAEEVNHALTDAVTQRLQKDGMIIKDAQPIILSMKFTEAAGEQRRIVEKNSPFDFRGRDTGRTATDDKGSLEVQLRVAGNDKPIWEHSLAAMSATSFHEQINDATIRKSMLDDLTMQIQRTHFPYFIPADAKLPALPIVAE